jgi:hypothetical protein
MQYVCPKISGSISILIESRNIAIYSTKYTMESDILMYSVNSSPLAIIWFDKSLTDLRKSFSCTTNSVIEKEWFTLQ